MPSINPKPRQFITPAHKKVQELLYTHGRHQGVLARRLGLSAATITNAKKDPFYNPNKNSLEAIDSLYVHTNVLWSEELESIGVQLDEAFMRAHGKPSKSLDHTDRERAKL